MDTTKIRSALAKEYGKGTPLPDARRAVEKRLGLASGATIGFDRIYFEAIGKDSPLSLSPDAGKTEIRAAIRKRRDGKDGATVPATGATKGLGLRRWETVAASASVALGRKVSVREARDLYGSKETYVGKGTRVAAPGTRVAPGDAVA